MDCKRYRKTVDPKCDRQPGCRWVPGNKKAGTKGVCISKVEVSTDKPEPKPKPTTQPKPKPAKTQCRKHRKTKDPTCDSHPECEWVVGAGCRSRSASTKNTSSKAKLTTQPKSSPNEQPDPLFGPKLKKMTGFHHLAYFDNLPGGRKTLLLGEFHDIIYGCPTCTQQEGCSVVTDYLKKLDQAAEKAGRCLDVFVETQKHKKDKLGGGKKYLVENVVDLRIEFTDLTQEEKNTRYPNTRFHHWDLRQLYCGPTDNIYQCEYIKDVFIPIIVGSFDVRERLISIFNEYPGTFREKARLIFDYYVTGYRLRKSEEFVSELIRHIPGFTKTDLKKNIKHIEYTRYKIQKAVEKIDKKLQPYFIKKSLFDRYFDVWWDFLEITLSIPTPKKLNVDNAREFFTLTSCFTTDLYLFARMFSVFQKSKQTEGVGCRKQMYPKNIIVYGGSFHTRLVGGLIQDIFGDPKNHYYVGRTVSCIKLGKLTQFF